jgi:hypothetical protein
MEGLRHKVEKIKPHVAFPSQKATCEAELSLEGKSRKSTHKLTF